MMKNLYCNDESYNRQCCLPTPCVPNLPSMPTCGCGCQCRPCSGGQEPEYCETPPDFACTDGVALFLNTTQPYPNSPICVEEAFNANDGPQPLTMIRASIDGTQQVVYDFVQTNVGQETEVSFTVKPILLVEFRDGVGVTHIKYIPFPVAVESSYPTPSIPMSVKYHVEVMPGATVVNLANTGNRVCFTAGFTLKITAYTEQGRLSIAALTTCTPSTDVVRAEFQRIRSACTVNETSILAGNIYFQPFGTPPLGVVSIEPRNQLPGVVMALSPVTGKIIVVMAFPAQIVLSDSTGRTSAQEVLVYTILDMIGTCFDFMPGDWLIADLVASYGLPQISESGDVMFAPFTSVTGKLTVLENTSEQVWVQPNVDCGPSASICQCKMNV